MSGPDTRVRAFATWLAVYPLITVVLVLSEPLLGNAPLPVQTLVLTAIVVPTAVYVAVPLVLRGLTREPRCGRSARTAQQHLRRIKRERND
jgi:antibiotic biosynthesis monooxygenase (ABM) superfamily enzyme